MAQNSPPPTGEDNPSWLHTLLVRVPGINRRADVIAGNVGAGSRNVVVGKNIIQIGALDISWWAIALILALLAGTALAAVFAVRGPTRMQGRFNIAVASFAVEGADGGVGRSADGAQLSRWVFDAIRNQQARYQAGGVGSTDSATVWHDSLPWTQQGRSIGFVSGATAEARESQARRIAETINAQVLIYGTLRRDQTVDLRFYVSPLVGIAGPSNAIAGHYQVGPPIRYSPAALEAGASELTIRGSGLFWLSAGLGYAGRGQSRQALAVLRQGEEQMQDVWDERGAGKEILYYFEGESALFQAVTATTAEDFETFTADAERSFRRALGSDPHYIRAQIGLGSLAYARAQCLLQKTVCPETPTSGADSRRLAGESIAAYTAALALAQQYPDQPWAADVGPLSLGTAYSLLGRIDFSEQQDDAAITNLTAGVAQINGSLEALRAGGDRRLLAQAYLTLGLANRVLGDIQTERGDAAAGKTLYTSARDAYAQCVQQGAADASPVVDKFLMDTLVPLCTQSGAGVEAKLRSVATP